MKRLLVIAAAALALAGCAAMKLHRNENPYEKPLFVQRYLNPGDPYDARILRTIDALRANPDNPTLHNDLGQLLAQRGFTKDAEREFDRAISADRKFYPAYYNRALLRMAQGDFSGARRDFLTTVRYKPGHAEALFQLGLMEEQRQDDERAISLYAKAFSINHSLLDVKTNPRVLDSKLIPLALLRMYAKTHARTSMQFVPSPPVQTTATTQTQPAPSPQPPAAKIVTPAAPVNDPGVLPAIKKP